MTQPPWHPEQLARRLPALQVRQRVIAAVRAVFSQADFMEVDTPILQISPGNEVHLQAFQTQFRDPHGGPDRKLYLHTSPEFAMKKLLVAGLPRIFQLAHVFRNAELSSRHHPEFTMLEWYRTGAGLDAIRQDCMTLVRAAAVAAGRPDFSYRGLHCDPFVEWENLTIVDAFQRHAGIDLLATMSATNVYDAPQLAAAAAASGVRVATGDSWDDLFFRVMAERIEPQLGRNRPTFLCDYPIAHAALAKPKADDLRFAERFELYLCGLELANAFDELTDPAEQERRFTADMVEKERIHGERYPIDADFIAALRHGMPATSGIALGFDRLVMLCAGVECVEDVLWLPVAVTP